MSYLKQLHPWCVIRILPKQQLLDSVGNAGNLPNQNLTLLRDFTVEMMLLPIYKCCKSLAKISSF